jgi:hypothetical protein
MHFTHHAVHRIDQRGIQPSWISLVLLYGTKIYNGGGLFVFMRRKDVPISVSPSVAEKLEGITLLLDPATEAVITVYKNRQAIRNIKRKIKHRINGEPFHHPGWPYSRAA